MNITEVYQNGESIAISSSESETNPLRIGVDSNEQLTASQAVLERTTSPEFPPLTVEDVEALRAGNINDDRIREIAAFRGTKSETKKVSKKDLAAILAERKDWLLKQSAGKPLFSGKVAGTLLVQAKYCDPVRGFNAFGDKLGKHGHNLPSVVINGVRHYDLTCIGTSAERKAARQQYFDRTPLDVLRELAAGIKKEPSGGDSITPGAGEQNGEGSQNN